VSKRDEITKALMDAPSPAAPSASPRAGPMSFVARAGQAAANGLAAENERLKTERSNGMVILRLDPKQITYTGFINRLTESFSAEDEEFRALKESIRRNGQLEPIRVRPSPDGSPHPYEVVYGHRRHAACLLLDTEVEGGFRVLALLDAAAVDPHRLTQLMHAENDARQPLSPFEYGQMYRSWLEANLFDTQEALAARIGRDQTTVSAYIRVAELPEAVLNAFVDRRAIALRWLQDLSKALKDDRTAVIAKAKRVAEQDPRPEPHQVLRELVSAASQGKRGSTSREETVKFGGRVGCRIIRKDRGITVRFPTAVDRRFQAELADQIRTLVEAHFRSKQKGRP
jgi:ParB family chromosome partitioning protein